jgi:hypothetical protein
VSIRSPQAVEFPVGANHDIALARKRESKRNRSRPDGSRAAVEAPLFRRMINCDAIVVASSRESSDLYSMEHTMYTVIGSAGQVGQEFQKVVARDRLHMLTRADLDITDAASVMRCIDHIDCSTIICLAAFHDVNGCESNPELANAVNTAGAANVAVAARNRGAKLVFFSSDYVFGGDATRQTPYLERDAPAPLNV